MLYVWCLFCCLLSTFRCHAGCCSYLLGLSYWGLQHCNPLELICGRHMCHLVMVIGPHQVCTEWLLPPLPWVGGKLLLLIQLFPSHPIYMVGHTALVVGRESPDPCTCPAWWEGSLFPGFVPSYDTVNSDSVMGIKPCDSLQVGDWVSGWWVCSHQVCRAFCCLFPGLSWVHWQV